MTVNQADYQGRYDFIPSLLKRLFTWGLLWSAIFFCFWYMGGMHIWASFVTFGLKLLSAFQVPLSYSVDQGALIFPVQLGGNPSIDVGYFANQWNLAIAEVVLLLVILWNRNQDGRFLLVFLCILTLVSYQMVAVALNITVQAIGPNLPNRLGILWEYENSFSYLILRKAQLFETFIGRYWVGFPLFGIALIIKNSLIKKRVKKTKIKFDKR